MGLSRTKKLYTAKKIVFRVQRQSINWKIIYTVTLNRVST